MCFVEMWARLDMFLSSNLSSKKVIVNPVPTSKQSYVGQSAGLSSYFCLSFEPSCHGRLYSFV